MMPKAAAIETSIKQRTNPKLKDQNSVVEIISTTTKEEMDHLMNNAAPSWLKSWDVKLTSLCSKKGFKTRLRS